MSHTLSSIAKYLDAELRGDSDCEISSIASLGSAAAGQISFLYLPSHKKKLLETKASAVILSQTMAEYFSGNTLIVDNPHLAYAKLTQLFAGDKRKPVGIHSSAVIGENCQIDSTATIGPGCVVGDNVTVGADAYFYPNVTVYSDVVIGERVILHSGVVIGSDGFGMAQDNGVWHKVEHLGGVVIGDDVELGANTTVDRGVLGDTVIEEGVKLDNQVQIAHNVHIGAHTVMAACGGIAGSSVIGKHCMIGGYAGISDHVTICDKVILVGGSMVGQDITEPGAYGSATPLMPFKKWKRHFVRYMQLDEIEKRLKQLEKLHDDN